MECFIDALKDSKTLAYAFWLSIFLLMVFSLLKYFISKERERKDWGNLILEFPIDVCLVMITIVITGFMKGENLSLGMIFVAITLVISIFCCFFRRCSINNSYKEGKWMKTIVYGILDIVIAIAWIYIVYSNIC